MLEIKNVSKKIKNQTILDDVTLSVNDGTIAGFIGLNGAGKSTLFKIVTSLMTPSGGSVALDDVSLIDHPCHRTGYMIETPAFYGQLTARQNLELLAVLHGGIPAQRIDQVLALVGLNLQEKKSFRHYSLGMKQRLYFAYALLKEPKLLVLDEPFNGLDAVVKELFKLIVRKIKNEGGIVLIADHVIDNLKGLCDEFYIVDAGKLKYHCTDPAAEDIEQIFLRSVSPFGEVQ